MPQHPGPEGKTANQIGSSKNEIEKDQEKMEEE
jgi:hypothetical protein